MRSKHPHILCLNGGSSSIKFAVYLATNPLELALRGKLDRIGLSGTKLTFQTAFDHPIQQKEIVATDLPSGIVCLFDWLEKQEGFSAVQAVGHRVVHGMSHLAPEQITPTLLEELRGMQLFVPDHLPEEIKLIEYFRQRHPQIPQVACFDTSFHGNLPRVAKMLAIPRGYETKGIHRYGFHGLSYSYLMEELGRLAGAEVAAGRVVLAHLGNGASLAAVRSGRSVDTSMGFTPTAGIPMGTRSGDLDPGLASYLGKSEGMSPDDFYEMVNHKSGLLGISETSSDMRDLVSRESEDFRAAEAVAFFCYQVRKWIGAYAAALGGLETLVFSGGIGENTPVVRSRICAELGFLGIELNAAQNKANAGVLSSHDSRVTVRLIRTDEELMIARSVQRLLAQEKLGTG